MRHADYDKHMDDLTEKISDVLDGEDLFDAAMASAAVMTLALNAMSDETRARAKKLLAKFIADLEAGGSVAASRPSLQ
jgi:cytochrome c556